MKDFNKIIKMIKKSHRQILSILIMIFMLLSNVPIYQINAVETDDETENETVFVYNLQKEICSPDNDRFTVTASLSENDLIDKNVSLIANKISEDYIEYEQYMERAKSLLANTETLFSIYSLSFASDNEGFVPGEEVSFLFTKTENKNDDNLNDTVILALHNEDILVESDLYSTKLNDDIKLLIVLANTKKETEKEEEPEKPAISEKDYQLFTEFNFVTDKLANNLLKGDEITKDDDRFETVLTEDRDVVDGYYVTYYRLFEVTYDEKDQLPEDYDEETSVKVDLDISNSFNVDEEELAIVFVSDGKYSLIKPEVKENGETIKLEFELPDIGIFALVEYKKEIKLEYRNREYHIKAVFNGDSGIPSNAQLQVIEIFEEDDEYEEYVNKSSETLGENPDTLKVVKAIDISLINPETKETYQPDNNVIITIELADNSLDDFTNVEVLHISDEDDEAATLLSSSVDGETIEFVTDGFSVFVVIGSNSELVTPRLIFRFHVPGESGYTDYAFIAEDGTTVYEQKIKNGEKPTIPSLTSTEQQIFAGWYEGTPSGDTIEFAEEPYDFDNIPEFTEDGQVDLYAVFKDYLYVTFYDQYDKTNKNWSVAYSRRGENISQGGTDEAKVKISDVSVSYNSDDDTNMAFIGWSYTPISIPGSSKDDYDQPVSIIVPDQDGCITINKNTILYPVFGPINWLTYYAGYSGSGADYIPPASYNVGDPVGTSLPVTSRKGFVFDGWYTGTLSSTVEEGETVEIVNYGVKITNSDGSLVSSADDGNVYISDGYLYLRGDETLYARWIAEYKIIIWKQKTSDDPDASVKNYEFVESVTKQAQIGSRVSVDDEYKHREYVGYHFSSCDDKKTILYSKTTVLNVYYDLNAEYTPIGGTYVLTFADSVTGEGASPMPDPVNVNYDAQLPVPTDPVSSRKSENEKAIYEFAGWFMDSDCTVSADLKKMTMPDHDLTVYAGWKAIKYRVQIDPNYGSLYYYDDGGVLQGTGSTWFNNSYVDNPIGEYTHVTRDYEESNSGTYYYVKHDLDYYDNDPPANSDRKTYYTKNVDEATEYNTYEYVPGVYTYSGWYEVFEDGSEASQPYDFTQHTDHNTTLKLHWKKNGVYYIAYDAGEGTLDDETHSKELLIDTKYSDTANVLLTYSANAPDKYTFAGWKVRGSESNTIYGAGQTLTLNAEDAIRISGKEIVFLEAVYTKVGMAKIIYDANGGIINNSTADFGKKESRGEDSEIIFVNASGTVDTEKQTATVVNLNNNSLFILSTGKGFTKDGAEFLGWSTEPIYDPADSTAKFYPKGSTETYGIDKEEPTTVYAVWGVTVTYKLNNANALWGGEWDPDIYTYDPVTKSYSQTVYLNNSFDEPSYIPTSNVENEMFDFWATTADYTTATPYDFSKAVTKNIDLYAIWSGPKTLTVNVVDASSEELSPITDWSVNNIQVGTTTVDLDNPAEYVTPAEDYEFAFITTAENTSSISDKKTVAAVKYDSLSKKICVRFQGSEDFVSLTNDQKLYFVYFKKETLDIKYQKMSAGSSESVTISDDAPVVTGKLGNVTMGDVVTSPLTWLVGGSASFYAYGIGNSAEGMNLITDISDSDSSRPSLSIRKTWRGFEYTTDGADWIQCGYEPDLYVLYFDQQPNIITINEKTIGTDSVREDTSFDYTAVVTNVISTDGDPQTLTFDLKDGESRTIIAYYWTTTDGESTVEHKQNVVVTQTAKDGFTTDNNSNTGSKASDNEWEYTTSDTTFDDYVDPEVVFTNTNGKQTITINIAIVDENGIILKNAYIDHSSETRNTFELNIGEEENFLSKVPYEEIYNGPEDYAFGSVIYGQSGDTESSEVTVKGSKVASIAYSQVEDNQYELVLKDSDGNRIGVLDGDKIYYLYYPKPRIRYVKLGSDGALIDIHGKKDGVEDEDVISYLGSEIIMNGVKVIKNQPIEISIDGFVISQSGAGSFKMPPILDDGTYEMYLSYSQIGIGANDDSTVSSLSDISDETTMYLRIVDNTLQYSFDNENWKNISIGDIPTIFAIYTDRGYDLQINKTVDISESGADPLFIDHSFSVTLSSMMITKPVYEIEGGDTTTVTATPASDGNPGTIKLEVRDGTQITIKEMGRGDYTILEEGKENFTLTVKKGKIIGGNSETIPVTDDCSVDFSLDSDTKIELINSPKPLCKIDDIVFYTLNSAINYVEEEISSKTATVEMLRDYTVPATDTVTIASDQNITFTTAEDFVGDGPLAVLTRDKNLKNIPMFVNNGSLGFTSIEMDGLQLEANVALIESDGDLALGESAEISGMYNSNNGAVISATNGNITINGAKLTGNKAPAGGVVNYTGNGEIMITGPAIITNNIAESGNGGAIYAANGSIDILGNANISSNNAENGFGGAIYIANGIITIDQATSFTNNAAKEGGAIYVGSGNVTVSETAGATPPSISNNIASSGNGGAISVGTGSIELIGGKINDNTAKNGYGGAVYTASASVEISGKAKIDSNKAKEGGAIYSGSGIVTVSGGELAGNTASAGTGGAVHAGSGNVSISGGIITENTAVNGGGVYTGSGSLSVNNGATINNNTASVNGGAFYVNSGTASFQQTSLTGNTAVNGSAVYVSAGKADFVGGNYTSNVSTNGGAIGAGNSSVRLTFSGDVNVTENKLGTAASSNKSNLYLDHDSDNIIQISGLGSNASIGIYIPDELTEERDVPGARFASYTDDSNITNIKNDRFDFGVQKDESSKKLFWGKPIKVQVRYLETYRNGLPPAVSGVEKYSNDSYYPEFSSAAISELAEELFNKYDLKLTSTAVYAGAFDSTNTTYFEDYLVKICWDVDESYWAIEKRDGNTEALGDRAVVIYYSEPTYISIENNTDLPLNISDLTVGSWSVINSSTNAGYGMIFAKNGAIQKKLLPITAADLQLGVNSSINMLIPGGRNMTYELNGVFTTETGKTVRLRRTGLEEKTLTPQQVKNGFTLDGTTLNSNGTYEIIFGDDKYICKITDEHLFTKISDAVNFAKTEEMTTAVIEMLVDYLLPTSDKVVIPKGYNITLQTAKDGTYKYEGEGGRATISRDSANTNSMITTDIGDVNSYLTIKDLIFDGKSVRGSSDGGAVYARYFYVKAENVDFINVYAGNGGALYVDDKNNGAQGKSNSVVETINCNFVGCNSTKATGSRLGGGAIHAFSNTLIMRDCIFKSCFAADQAGAVFHRVDDNNFYTETSIERCTFSNCSAKAAGGLELDSRVVNVSDCVFEHCIATDRNGGGFNVYALNNANPGSDCWVNVSNTKFDDCHQTNLGSGDRYGGAFRSTAKYTVVNNCEFTNISAKRGGAIGISSSNAVSAGIYGCTINGSTTTEYGGGIYCSAKEIHIGDYTDAEGKIISTTIKNCSAGTQGGGVYQSNNNAGSIFDMSNSNISECTSNSTGGGIDTRARNVIISDSNISNNTSNGNGGGLCSGADSSNVIESLMVSGTTLSGNSSKGNGGGIYTTAKTMQIEESVINNCTASLCGGGIYHNKDIDGSSLTISESSIKNNVSNDSLTNNDEHGGGGICVHNVRSIEIKDSIISGNKATRNGGGILSLSNSNDRIITVDNTKVTDNTSGNKGGGIFTRTKLTLCNETEVTGNHLSTNTSENAAGIYMINGRTLVAGLQGAETDTITVNENYTASGVASNLRLWEINSQNDAASVYVYCNLSGDIRVVNAKKVGTQFGSSAISKPIGFTDDNYVFKADSSTLHGIIDRSDETEKKIIWAGPPIAKITDGSGHLLYFKENGNDPAIFDRLGISSSSSYSTIAAFNMLCSESPALFNKDGTPYTGNDFCIKMLDNYETMSDINVKYYEGRTITFTTAGKSSDDEDGYPYVGTGTRATVVRGSGVPNNRTLLNVSGNLVIEKIIIDGGSENGITPGVSTRCIWIDNNANVTLSNESVLQNANTTANGGGVNIKKGTLNISGGIIRNCKAVSGAGVYNNEGSAINLIAGNITQCTASDKGGAVYVNSGKFNMSGGTIDRCFATQGGGVFLTNNSNRPFNMSGGTIMNNTATEKGGGVAVEGDKSRIYLSGKPAITGNKLNGVTNNIELSVDSNSVINTNNGGLYSGAYVGVYVTDGENLYDKHGQKKQPFGTFANNDNTTTLYCFVNDRNGLKGGIIEEDPQPNTIYWVEIFGLQVSKTIEANKTDTIDPDEEFEFTVNIRGKATSPGQKDAKDIDSRTGYYGEMEFTSNGKDTTTATFKLKAGETITAINLSEGLTYEVIEELSADQAKKYATVPGTVYSSHIGENKQSTEVDPYTSVVDVINILPICKITDNQGNQLMKKYTWHKKEIYIPAVYTDLLGNDGAYKASDGPLYQQSGNVGYDVSQGVQIQMLIDRYQLTEELTVNNNAKLTLTTASASASKFPYRGSGSSATIVRGQNSDNSFTGSIFTINGNLTLRNIIIDGNKYEASANGGIVHVNANAILNIENGAVLQNASVGSYTQETSTVGYKGGAIYASASSLVKMSGGRIQNNSSDGDGAGIYLKSGSTLELSGSPNFGGKGTTVGGRIVYTTGNFKNGTLIAKTNGEMAYLKARQDIYLEEANENNPQSIRIVGNLSGDDGSIWVWAESAYHNKTMMPFAKLSDNVTSSNNSAIFRNAQDDVTTENETGTYLSGTTDGDTPGYLYWSGNFGFRQVIIRKTNGSFTSLSYAVFNVYRGSSTDVYKVNNIPLRNLTSDSNGVVWVGTLPYGTYYLQEVGTPSGYSGNMNKWFCLIIDETGDYMSTTAESTKDRAYENAKTVKNSASA